MSERLQVKYPRWYDIPSDQCITNYISSLTRDMRQKGSTNSNEVALHVVLGRSRIPEIYTSALAHLLDQTSGLIRGHGCDFLVHYVELDIAAITEDFPSEQESQGKMASLQPARKRNQQN